MTRVWELESEEEVGKLMNCYYPAVKTVRQQRAEASIKEHLKQVENGQYQTRLLWGSDRRPRNNYVEAKKAFVDWERRLDNDERTKKAFHTAMSNWIVSNYLESAINVPEGPQNFLTTFMVFRDDKPDDKGRMVVNGARKFKGECLNDFLETGSNLMTDLSELLLRIRRHRFVVCCDLEQMFLNIKVAPEDQKYLRMFYRENPDEELKVYQFNVHVFGLSSSPYVAMSVVKAHAKCHGDRWPIAEKAIRQNSLVDDIWLISDDKAEVRQGMLEVTEVMKEMGITVHKWGSNCPELLRDIPMDKRAKEVKLAEEDNPAIKALGLTWDTERDAILFTKPPPIYEKWTLRTVTSSAGQLYDPLVLLGPTTIPAKLLIQLAWRYQDKWDDELPDCLAKKMTLYCKNQTKLDKFKVPRCVGNQQGRLVIFTDSSNLAQAAAAYWVSEDEGGLDANLVAAKTKVMGLRQHEHIGRLELVAAVMGVALAWKIARAWAIPMQEVIYFTDSMAVLYWLSTPASLSAFTGHRVAKIGERSQASQWNYVNTIENPSDLPTRGMRAADLNSCELWWKGPDFLRKPRHEWPEQPPIRSTEAAAAETRTIEEIAPNIIMKIEAQRTDKLANLVNLLLQKGVGLRKAIRSICVLAGLFWTKFKNDKFLLTFRQVELSWIKHEQRERFKQLYQELTQHKRVTNLRELDPRLDHGGGSSEFPQD